MQEAARNSCCVSQLPLLQNLWVLLKWLPTSGRDIVLTAEKIRLFFCPEVPSLRTREHSTHDSPLRFSTISLSCVLCPGQVSSLTPDRFLKIHGCPQERLKAHPCALLWVGAPLSLTLQRSPLFRKATPKISAVSSLPWVQAEVQSGVEGRMRLGRTFSGPLFSTHS